MSEHTSSFLGAPAVAPGPVRRWTARLGRWAATCGLLLAPVAWAMSPLPANPPDLSASAPGAAASGPAGAASSAQARDPSALKPFADVIKGAKRQEGWVPVWRKDDKLWLEIKPELLNKPLLVSANITHSVGERGLYASQMGPGWLAEFRRVANTVQLIALNTDFQGGTDPAARRAVRQAFSESLIGSAQVASAPSTENKAILIDASFLLGDLTSYATRLDAAYRLPFSLDRGNSYFENATTAADLTTVAVRLHFAIPRMPSPPVVPSPVMPVLPSTLADPRSLFVGVLYNFRKLPEKPMASRLADARIGHFTEAYTDFGSDLKPNQRVHHVVRWRLEKKDAKAALSEPIKPITYWLDRNIPKRYRAAVEDGVLAWNKAFEKLGYKNAIVVRQQADDAEFDTQDANHASIRWFVGADVGFAVGPTHTDPRTGEILDADIAMSDVFARSARRVFVEDALHAAVPEPTLAGLAQRLGRGDLGHPAPAGATAWGTPGAEAVNAPWPDHHVHDAHCHYAHEAAREMHFVLDLLEARGELAPDSPEAEAFVQAVIKDTITHEVGHTLGLKHNFKASSTITRAQLRDPAYTAEHGISGSVMDYNGYNLALPGEPAVTASQNGLGAYDFWAIEYAYAPAVAKPEEEAQRLATIAARSTEPALAFGDDADADGPNAVDPLVNRFDLGDDPMAWSQRRVAMARELWQRAQSRPVQPGDDPQRTRRALLNGFRQLAGVPALLAKYVGGMHSQRGAPGAVAYQPVPAERQREALKLLTEGYFGIDSFNFRPEFLATLVPDYLEWARAAPVSLPSLVQQLQVQALDRLMSAGTAQRLLDAPLYVAPVAQRNALTLDELHATLQGAVWAELKGGGREVEPLRRTLQREHLRRLVAGLTLPVLGLPADALSIERWHATRLQTELKAAAGKAGLSVATRAHYAESLSLLTEALRASMSRL